jgi:hypothetical protein
MLLQDEGIDRINDHVPATVHDERGLMDRLEVLVRTRTTY